MNSSNPSTPSALPDIDSLWDYARPAETEIRFREIVPQAEIFGDRAYHATLLTQLGRSQALQRKFDEARKTLDRAEALLAGHEEGIPTIRYLLERGRLLNSSGDRFGSRSFFRDAFEMALRQENDYLAVDAAHMLAIAEEPEEALHWSERAIGLVEKSSDERVKRWMGPLYNNTGWTYHDRGEYDRALELFEKNVLWHTEMKSVRELVIARWAVARTLRSLGRIEEALAMQTALLEESREKGSDDDGYIHEEIAESLLALGRPSDAAPYFARAYQLLSADAWLADKEPERLKRMKELGEG